MTFQTGYFILLIGPRNEVMVIQQIQPIMNTLDGTTFWDCVGFYSVGTITSF